MLLGPMPFVGRQAELGALASALTSAEKGEGSVVLVCGEAGIGKTRLAQELVRLAARQRALALWGNCYEDEGAPAYRPWAEIVAAYVDQTGPEAARAHMGDGAADLAEVIPPVRLAMPDLPIPPRIDALAGRPEERGQLRYRLADSMRHFLGRASAATPLVMVFDALQYSDRASLWLLEMVARNAATQRTLILATYTEREVRQRFLEETLGELDKLPWSHRIRLGALGRGEVESLVVPTLGSAAEPRLLEEIWRKTEGIPLFVTEALKCLVGRTQKDLAGSWDTEAAGMVRIAVSRRVNRMPGEHRDVLAAAAILGREVALDQLARILGAKRDTVAAALDDAVSLGLLDDVGPVRYRFTHDLVREAVEGLLSAAVRTDLHMRIGQVLEHLRERGETIEASRIAHHYRCAGDTGRAGAIKWTTQAGEDALAAHAPEDAAKAFDTVLAVLPADSRESSGLLLRKAYALVSLGRYDDARFCLEQAFARCQAAGDITGIMEAATFPFVRAIHLRRRALAMVAPDSHDWARIACELVPLEEPNDPAEATRLCKKATAVARRQNDRALEARVLSAGVRLEHHSILPWWHPYALERAIQLSREVGDTYVEAWLRTFASYEASYVGNAGRAREHAARLAEAAKVLRVHGFYDRADSVAAVIDAAAGDWKSWREILEPRLAAGETNPFLLVQAALLFTQLGENERARDLLDRLALLDRKRDDSMTVAQESLRQSRAACAAWAAFARVAGGEREGGMAGQLARAILETDRRLEFRAYARTALALAALQEGDKEEVEKQLAEELLIGPCYLSVWAMMVIDRVRALCAAALGRDDQARSSGR